MRLLRSPLRLAAGALALLLAAAACTGGGGASGAGSGGGTVLQGGILHIGTDTGPDSVNPFVAQSTDSFTIFEYIYPELVQYDANLKISPAFASSWQTTNAGRTWTFHTRPNVMWSDGKPLTAADAAWTINTTLKFGKSYTSSLAPLVSHSTGAAAPNANTLVIQYSRPVANVLPQLQELPILPQHVWETYATGDGKALKTYPNTPQNGQPVVSGGPFVLTKYEANSIALFQKNPNFYGPAPHIDGFGLQTFTNDDAMVQALLHGQIDDIEVVPPTSVQTISNAGFAVTTRPGIWVNYVAINSNPKKTSNPELQNPLVREAFSHALDRARMDQVAYDGYAKPAGSVITPPTGSWWDPNIHPASFDLALANRLLDQAGYARGPGGIRVANGHPMQYQLVFPHWMGGAGERMLQIMQSDFRQIGVVITEQALDGNAAWQAITAPGGQYLKYDLTMGSWAAYVDPDFQLSVFLCDQWGNWNDSAYCNPAYDKMYAQQGTLINPKARQQLVWKMQTMIAKDLPYLNINYPDWVEAHSTAWTGFIMTPQGSFNEMGDLSLLSVHRTG